MHVTSATFDDHVCVQAVDENGDRHKWRAKELVDATGRDTFLASRLGLKKKNPKHGSATIFGHFKNAGRLAGRDAGNIGILWFEHGWFWMIPLKDGLMSIGTACSPEYLKTRGAIQPADFACETRSSPARGVLQVIIPISRHNLYGDRWLTVGGAIAFVAPVFSSSVYLAMNSESLGAEVVDARLRGLGQAPQRARRYKRTVTRGLPRFSWFIYSFTSPPMQRLFMGPKTRFACRRR